MAPSLPVIRRTEIDGVPTFWADSHGPLVGALMFRVGRSDETLPTCGVTHFVEHLAMSRLGSPVYEHNASVDNLRTIFHAAGRVDEIVAFLENVTASLREVPLDRLDMERGVVRSESDSRQPGVFEALRLFRFGPAGHGLVAEQELGIGWLGRAEVAGWAREYFTRHNAALWLSGPPPAALRVPLPDGSRRQVSAPEASPDVTLPAHATWDANGVAFSMIVERALGASVIPWIAQRRLREDLRFGRGLVYDVVADYTPLTADMAEVVIAADCPQDRIPDVRDAILGIVDSLAMDGPTEAELAIEADQFQRQLEDPAAVPGVLDFTVLDVLVGRPFRTPEERLEEQRGCTPAEVVAIASAGRRTALLLAAGEAAVDGFNTAPRWSCEALTGREHRPAGFSLPGRGPKERLFIGSEGVTLRLSSDELLTVRWRDSVGLEVFDTDERIVHGRDSVKIWIKGEHWRDGASAIQSIDDAVRPDLKIRGSIPPRQND